MQAIGELLRSVKDRYGDKVEICLKDPRFITSVWDNVRYKVQMRPPLPAWVVDRKKICDGIPKLVDLERAIDERLSFSV
jgi:hypothetical protein